MLSSNQIQIKKPIPAKYLCPITHQIMLDPVMAADGRGYEFQANNPLVKEAKMHTFK
jgi:hypothetical protein